MPHGPSGPPPEDVFALKEPSWASGWGAASGARPGTSCAGKPTSTRSSTGSSGTDATLRSTVDGVALRAAGSQGKTYLLFRFRDAAPGSGLRAAASARNTSAATL